jgi:hypothetical protein
MRINSDTEITIESDDVLTVNVNGTFFHVYSDGNIVLADFTHISAKTGEKV